MSLPVIFDIEARDDLNHLKKYYRSGFPKETLKRILNEWSLHARRLGLAPYRGAKREDIGPGV